MTDESAKSFRCSEEQQFLWNALRAGWPSWIRCVARLDGVLDAGYLREVCLALPGTHEILRTTFPEPVGTGQPRQVIHEKLTPSWELLEEGCESSIPACQAPNFQLQSGPVLHFQLTRVQPALHYLALSAPALCADACFLQEALREIVRTYCGMAGDRDDEAGGRLRYVDFAERQFQARFADAGTFRQAKSYWTSFDPSSLAAVVLPLEDRTIQLSSPGRTAVEYRIERDRVALIEKAAMHYGTPVDHVLLACWSGLLSRLTGQSDIAVVRVASGRSRPELQFVSGMLAKPLPLRMNFTGDPDFLQLIRRISDAVVESDQWQDGLAPADVMADGLEPRAALVGFEFTRRLDDFAAGPLSVSIASVATNIYPFKVRLACDWGETAVVRLESFPGLFPTGQAERIIGYFDRLLESVSREPHTPGAPIEDVDLLSAEDQLELESFGAGEASEAPAVCFHQLFEEQVTREPERTALVCGARRLTYGELNGASNRLAHYLQSQGVRRNDPVGLLVTRSAESIVAMLGILKAGGAYVPLHPDVPRARLELQLEQVGSRVVVTQESKLDALAGFDGLKVCLDREQSLLAGMSDRNPDNVAEPAGLIYVIFTSGSTGVPKAVAVRHENVVNYISAISRQLALDHSWNSGGLAFANVSMLSADLGNTAIFPALASGGVLHMVPDETLGDGISYGDYSTANRIDVLKITPSHLRALLTSGVPSKVLPRTHLIVGGETLTWELARLVRESGTCSLLNHYGPTETTIGALTFDVFTNDNVFAKDDMFANERYAAFASTVPIGRPLAGTTARILDRRMRPVPQGVAGELYIGGAGVAGGYFGQPEMTAARFLHDPAGSGGGLRFYRTGDRARWLPGGAVEFLGREDDQVKVRGFRVELGEIEVVLARHPAVEQAGVVVDKDAGGDVKLIACVLARGKPTAGELKEFLRTQLPDYMIPAAFVLVDAIPRNANGKIDRRALGQLAADAAATGAPDARRGSPVEDQMLNIWRRVLKREDVGPDDNFFELGGHSLLATMMIARARAEFHVQLPLRSIFELPTASALAARVERVILESQEEEELARLLSEVENLSEEEARNLVAGQTPKSGF